MTSRERDAMSPLECAVWGAAYVAILSTDHLAPVTMDDRTEMLASPSPMRQVLAVGGADEAVLALRRRIGP